MINKEILKRQILYRSTHRGTKEMDLILGNFVKKNIGKLNENDLIDLRNFLEIEDSILESWYFKNKKSVKIATNKISEKFKNHKLE